MTQPSLPKSSKIPYLCEWALGYIWTILEKLVPRSFAQWKWNGPESFCSGINTTLKSTNFHFHLTPVTALTAVKRGKNLACCPLLSEKFRVFEQEVRPWQGWQQVWHGIRWRCTHSLRCEGSRQRWNKTNPQTFGSKILLSGLKTTLES